MVSALMLCPRCWGSEGPCDRCDGSGVVPDVRLSRSFTLVELVRSQEARLRGLANDPTAIHLRRLRELCKQLLQPVRDAWGPLVVTSGYRTPEVNRRVGGSASSAHVSGWAADVRPVVDPVEVLRWLPGSGLAWDQAILYPGRVHLALKRPSSGAQRRELRQAVGGSYPLWRDAA